MFLLILICLGMSPRASIAKWVSKESIQVRQIWCHADGHFHRGFGSLPRYIPIFRRGRPRIKLVAVAWFVSMPGPLGESRVVTLNQGSENCPKSGPKASREKLILWQKLLKNLTVFHSSEMREKSLEIIQPRVICNARQFSSLSPVRYLRNPSLRNSWATSPKRIKECHGWLSTSYPWWMMIRLTSTDGQSQNTCICSYAMGYLILQLLCQINFPLKVLWKEPLRFLKEPLRNPGTMMSLVFL